MPITSFGTPFCDLWNGTTQYPNSQIRIYTNRLTTDANGRITVNLTQDATPSGAALFSTVLSVQALGYDGSGNALQAPLPFVQSLSGTQLIIRCVRGVSKGILIGGTINTPQFVGSGYTVDIHVTGLKA